LWHKTSSDWRGGLEFLKTKFLNQRAARFRSQKKAGMTLVEVVISLAITGLTVGGVVTGYIFCMTSSQKDALYMEANARALERLEQTRSAQWDISSYPVVDQLVASNFPDEVVTLDTASSGPNITTATIQTQISQISDKPAVRRVHVDCIWQFNGVGLITNSIETCRAPDQ
jgi:Tfp pilus assembly protein PilE